MAGRVVLRSPLAQIGSGSEWKGFETDLSDKKTFANLRTVAERVGLTPCSVSAVLNSTPGSQFIPQRTKDRILRAAEELNYRPNFAARFLRTKRSYMVAVISDDIGQAPVARIVAGMESFLRGKGYLLAVFGTSERNGLALQLQQRGIEGLMTIDAIVPSVLELPVVSIDLGCVTFREPVAAGVHTWLTELGKSAAQAVLGQIENKGAPQRRRAEREQDNAHRRSTRKANGHDSSTVIG